MTPTWYDLLGVNRDADPEEIRAAWKRGIADLEPGDRRFETLNRAAKVLLDPATREEYDASLAPEEGERPTPVDTPVVEEDAPAPEASGDPTGETGASASPSGVLLGGLAALALVMVAVTAWAWVRAGDAGAAESAAREAQQAAEAAVVPVLSYDYRQLAEDQERAQALMTGSYREDYDEIFAVIEENAPRLKTQVSVSVVASGIVRASDDRVQVLVFVDRPTTNKQQQDPVVYKDQVTLTMQEVDGEWLVDDMVTSPVPD